MSSAQAGAAPPAATGLGAGVRYALRGIPFTLGRPRLLALAIIPIAINVALFVLGLWLGLQFFDQLFAAVFRWQRPDGALLAALWSVAAFTAKAVLLAAVAAADFVAVVACGTIVAAPFNDALSERTENERRGHAVEQTFSLARALILVAGVARDQIVLLVIYALGFALLLLLNLVPAIGSLAATVLTFLWSAWFLALEFSEPPLTRAGHNWRSRWRALRQRTRTALGFGIGAWLLLLVPLTMPFLIVSGTLWVCDDRDLAAVPQGSK